MKYNSQLINVKMKKQTIMNLKIRLLQLAILLPFFVMHKPKTRLLPNTISSQVKK